MSRASNLAGFSTSISPPSNLNVGVVTASTLNVDSVEVTSINVGVITATTLSVGGVEVTSLGIGIATEGGTVGSAVTSIDFRGSGISTVTVSSGIATVNIEGGGAGGGFSPVNFILS